MASASTGLWATPLVGSCAEEAAPRACRGGLGWFIACAVWLW